MKILVTGGAGFIGYHVVKRLCGEHDVLIVDALHPYYDPSWKRRRLDELLQHDGVHWRNLDICRRDDLRSVFAAYRPDKVIHLAAIPGVQPSLADPASYAEVNVKGTVHLLQLAAEYPTSGFVFASSSSVYGAQGSHPCREEDELLPESPYAAAKASGEMYCRMYERLYRVPVTITRFFTVYGPEQRPDMALWNFAVRICRGEPIVLYGNDIGRDYTYVTDTADGVARAALTAEAPAGDAPHRTYNLGSGRVVRIRELVALLEHALGRKARIEYRDLPAGDVPLTWADTRKSERELGFRADTRIEEGIPLFAEWFLCRKEVSG